MERRPVTAGSYFPSSGKPVSSAILALCEPLAGCERYVDDVFGVMVPHASLDYCGKVAAALWKRIRVPSRVIAIGPNHTGLGCVAAVASGPVFRTPAGDMPVDSAMCAALVDGDSPLIIDDGAHEEEHSIEAVLPFVQTLNPQAVVTPVCLRMLSFQECRNVASRIAAAIRGVDPAGGPVLIVASSDMNHGDPVRIALRRDRMVLDRIEAMDPSGLYEAVVEHHLSMCGVAPVVVMLLAAMELGAGYAETTAYATSMDRTGDPSSVVGYASVIVRRRCPVDRIRNLDSGHSENGGNNGKG